MVEKADVFRCALEIFDDGDRPTLRSVRERLGNVGSFSDISPFFVEWCTQWGYQPRPTKKDLPKQLTERYLKVAAEIWCDGRHNGAIAAQNEAELHRRARDVALRELADMTALVDELHQRLAQGNRQAANDDDIEVEVANPRANPKAFWAGVMQEIVDLLEDRQMPIAEILEGLSERTLRLAPELLQRGGSALLAYKMSYHANRGRHFVQPEKNSFRRRA